jgi:predicted enzyme related to lactoylglutathione lyase
MIRDDDGGIGGLQRGSPDRRPQTGARLYWQVEDLEGVLDRARALGAVVERKRTELGGDDRWFATLLDPAGVSVGFWTDREAIVEVCVPAVIPAAGHVQTSRGNLQREPPGSVA